MKMKPKINNKKCLHGKIFLCSFSLVSQICSINNVQEQESQNLQEIKQLTYTDPVTACPFKRNLKSIIKWFKEYFAHQMLYFLRLQTYTWLTKKNVFEQETPSWQESTSSLHIFLDMSHLQLQNVHSRKYSTGMTSIHRI